MHVSSHHLVHFHCPTVQFAAEMTNAGQEAGKGEPSATAGGNVDGDSCHGPQQGGSPQN